MTYNKFAPFINKQFFDRLLAPNTATLGVVNMKDMNTEHKEALKKAILDGYAAESCGICKKPGADVFWFSRYSRCAHKSCYNLIKDAESDIDNLISTKIDQYHRTNVQIAVVDAVEKACGMTLFEFVAKNGVEALKKIYNSAGFNAIGLAYYMSQKASL